MDRRQQKTREAIFMHSAHCLKRKATISITVQEILDNRKHRQKYLLCPF